MVVIFVMVVMSVVGGCGGGWSTRRHGSVCASVVGGCRGGLVVVAAVVVALVSAVCVCSLCWLWCRFGENEFPL